MSGREWAEQFFRVALPDVTPLPSAALELRVLALLDAALALAELLENPVVDLDLSFHGELGRRSEPMVRAWAARSGLEVREGQLSTSTTRWLEVERKRDERRRHPVLIVFIRPED